MAGEVEVERLLVRLVGDASDYQRMLRDAQTQSEKSTRDIAKSFARMAENIGRSLQNIGRRMQRVGRSLTLRLTAPIIALGGVSVKAFANFDKAMIESLAIMNTVGDEAERMRDLALKLGTEGIKGPRDLAEAYFFLASAGKDAEQSMALLPPLMKFATAGAFDMALATDLLTDAQSALGLTSKNAQQDMINMTRLSDLLVGANTLANASVQQFSTALTTKAGSALKAYNIRVEEGIALLAAYADRGVKAELAGNALDRVVRLLTKATAQNSEVFEELGVHVFNAQGEFNTFENIIGDLENALRGMSTEQKAATLTSLGFEARIQSVILPLIGSSEAIGNYVEQLDKMGGITERVANKQMKSFSNQMTRLRNQLTAVAIEIGEILAPAMKKIADIVSEAATRWSKLEDSTKRIILVIAGFAAAIGPALIALGSLLSVMGFAVLGLKALAVAFTVAGLKAAAAWAAATLGISLLITGLVALGIKLSQSEKFIDRVRMVTKPLFRAFNELWVEIKTKLLPELEKLGKELLEAVIPLMNDLSDILTDILPIVIAVGVAIGKNFITALRLVAFVVRNIVVPALNLLVFQLRTIISSIKFIQDFLGLRTGAIGTGIIENLGGDTIGSEIMTENGAVSIPITIGEVDTTNLVNALEEVVNSNPLRGLVSEGVDATLAGTFRARDLENAFRQMRRDTEQNRIQQEIERFRMGNPIGLRNRLSTRETLRPSPDETKQIEREARRSRGEGLGQAEMIGLTKSLVDIGILQLEKPTIDLDPAGFN